MVSSGQPVLYSAPTPPPAGAAPTLSPHQSLARREGAALRPKKGQQSRSRVPEAHPQYSEPLTPPSASQAELESRGDGLDRARFAAHTEFQTQTQVTLDEFLRSSFGRHASQAGVDTLRSTISEADAGVVSLQGFLSPAEMASIHKAAAASFAPTDCAARTRAIASARSSGSHA